MVWDVIGVTGWTLRQIGELTFPQLQFIVRGRGRILWPRLQPQIAAGFANVSDKPAKPGELSDVDRIIRDHERSKSGANLQPTAQEQRRARAFRIVAAPYLGDPDRPTEGAPVQRAEPIPGMSVAEARSIVAYVQAGRSSGIWGAIAESYPRIWATAQQGVSK